MGKTFTKPQQSPSRPVIAYRHTAVVRAAHWIAVLCLSVLLMSGLQIFNAHPALYWGDVSMFDNPFLTLPGGRGFPGWITLPGEQDLATGRRWHFFFAWLLVSIGLVYYLHGFASGHWRALVPTRRQFGRIGKSIGDHLRFRFDHGANYNVLQKLSYLAVLAVLLPLMVASGLAMSPAIDAAVPQLVSAFGGRQSARTVHFLTAWSLVAFAAVHVAMVLVSGVWNNLRSMITGRYVTQSKGGPDDQAK